MSHSAFTSERQSSTALWPVHISRRTEDRRLSWPRWLVTHRGGLLTYLLKLSRSHCLPLCVAAKAPRRRRRLPQMAQPRQLVASDDRRLSFQQRYRGATVGVSHDAARLRTSSTCARSAACTTPFARRLVWPHALEHIELEMRGIAQRVVRPAKTNLQKLTGYRTKVRMIFTRRRGVIGGVNSRIHVAILPFVVECQRTE